MYPTVWLLEIRQTDSTIDRQTVQWTDRQYNRQTDNTIDRQTVQ